MHILSVCFSSSYKDSSSTWSNTSHHPTSFFLCKTPLLKDSAPCDSEMMSSKGRERNTQNNQWMRAGFRSLCFVWWKSSSTDPVQVWVRRARTLCLRLTPTLVHPTGSWATKVLLQLPAWYGQSFPSRVCVSAPSHLILYISLAFLILFICCSLFSLTQLAFSPAYGGITSLYPVLAALQFSMLKKSVPFKISVLAAGLPKFSHFKVVCENLRQTASWQKARHSWSLSPASLQGETKHIPRPRGAFSNKPLIINEQE